MIARTLAALNWLQCCPGAQCLTTAEAIAELLSSSDEADQAHYAIRLGAIHCKEAVEPLCGLLSKALESKSERLVIASLYALYCVCDVRSLPALLSAFPALYDRPRHLCIMALTRVLTRCVESVFQNEVGDTVQNSRVKFQFLRELLPEPGHLLRFCRGPFRWQQTIRGRQWSARISSHYMKSSVRKWFLLPRNLPMPRRRRHESGTGCSWKPHLHQLRRTWPASQHDTAQRHHGRQGTVSSASQTTVTDTGKSWYPDQMAGMMLQIADVGFFLVVSNTENSLTVASGNVERGCW